MGTRPMRLRPGPVALGALVVGLSLVGWRLLRHAGTSYDVEYHLAWGRDLLHGRIPGFNHQPGPTEHPLLILVGAAADLVPGIDPHALLHAGAYLSYGTLLLLVLLLATELFSWPAGAIAVGVLLTNSHMATTTANAGKDVPAATLVLLAILLAVRHPRNARPALVALVFAGLMRPEAWGLAGAFWLVQLPGRTNRDRARLGVLVLIAPVIWIGADLLVAGNPLYSFKITHAHAIVDQLQTGASRGGRALIDNLRLNLGRVVFYGGASGVLVAALLRWPLRRLIRPSKSLHGALGVPIAAVLLTTVSYLGLGANRLPLYERFLFVPAALLAVFFGFAVTSAWHLSPRPLALCAALLGVIVLARALEFVPNQIDRTRTTLSVLRDEYRALHGLEQATSDPAVNAVMRNCPSVAIVPYVTRPYLANDLGRRPEAIAIDRPFPERVAVFAPAEEGVQNILRLMMGLPARRLLRPARNVRQRANAGGWRLLTRDC